MDKKELKNLYKQHSPDMGIYAVKDKSGKIFFIEASENIQGSINSCKFQLNANMHKDKTLQELWNKTGENNFDFEILDILKRNENKKENYKEDLAILKQMRLEKINFQ
jgi:hypothetical protein